MNQDQDQDDEPIIPHHPKRNYRYTQQPPHHLLTYSQRSIPILVISSPKAKLIAAKNNLSLSEMLNGLGNSMMKESPSILGKLAPIRSVNRMINLKWDMICLRFLERFGYDTLEEDFSIRDADVDINTDTDTDNNKNADVGMEWEQRLSYASEIWEEEQDFELLEGEIESMFDRNAIQDSFPDSNGDGKDANHRVPDKGFSLLSQCKTPWYARFRNGINQQTSHQRYSMHCPPVVLYVATSSEGTGGLEALLEMDDAQTKHLPEEFRNGMFDFSSMKEQFLILHDEQDTTIADADSGEASFDEAKVLQEMRNLFGPGSAAVVRVNSNNPLDEANSQEEDAVWDEYLTPDTPKSQLEFTRNVHKIRGALLSSRDKLSLRRFISHMTTTVVMPAIERKIYALNVEVTNNKKGVKNVFKSFWRKPKDVTGLSSSVHGGAISNQSNHQSRVGGDNEPNAVPYAYDSIESQTRLLADTLFLIRDYEGAMGMYRLVKDDYKHDQNLLHNASVHEMMALSMYLIDLSTGYRNTREIVQCIDTAFSLYSNAAEEERLQNSGSRPLVAPIATRCVTRLSLLLSATRILCQGRDMETADSLASASSNETPLGAAVLLEQSSGHYHRAGMYRKFAFHILMAGHMFRSAGQETHAVRCFASALSVYHGGDRYWPELFNHLTSALAGQLYGMKRMQLSLQLYAELVGTTGGGRVSVRSQQKFIDHLVTICRSHSADALESSKRMKVAHYGNISSNWDEAEEVMLATPRVTRILEIPNMNLPKVIDSSIIVENSFLSSARKDLGTDLITFGKTADGLETVWQDLMCCTEAEIRVGSKYTTEQSPIDFTNRVLEEIEVEEKMLQTKSRLKKLSNKAEPPPIRAKLEPIAVSFDVSNPLSVMVPISSMQLVARLTHSQTLRVYTNIESLDIASDVDEEDKKSKKWKFAGSEKLFEVADFSRISPATDSNENIWSSGSANEVDPHFLVSKGKMAMEPRSKTRISLELCPLAMGDLEIVGVRCKIFNEIWVYHNFNVKGPLLHNTAFNRMNRIRGPPQLLRTKVESNMPSISVDVIQKKDNENTPVVLQGQVSKWTLRVSNQGAAHATNLCLKTNVPWFNICRDSEVAEGDEVSYCIGPSGTMMRLPLGHNRSSTDKVETLAPGQTLDIPIEIRTSGGGKQEFYMLFRYELFEKSSASKPLPQKAKTRWLRKMVSVAVYPSLTLTASITPSFSNKKDCILSVEMTNYRSDKETAIEIVVDKISIASKNYVIKPLVKRSQYEKTDSSLQGHSISWQEQAAMHYVISPIRPNSCKCSVSECTLGSSNEVNCATSSVTDFICLENAHDQFKASLNRRKKEIARMDTEQEKENQGPRSIAEIRRAKSQLSTSSSDENEEYAHGKQAVYHPASRAFLCSPQEVNIICSWKTVGEHTNDIIEGQHHLRQLAVRPQRKSKSCPLLIGAKYDPCVNHDFSTGPLHLGMEISLRNRLVRTAVDFQFSLQARRDITFIGPETFRKCINGGEEVVFPMEAILFESGMYNLQCVKLTVHDDSNTPYVFPLQWIVKVNA